MRDMGTALKERPEVPLRITAILADVSTNDISPKVLQEIVMLLNGHNDLIERCDILIDGKIEIVTSEDGSYSVVCSTSDGSEPHILWNSADQVIDVVKQGRKRRGKFPRNSKKAKEEGMNVQKGDEIASAQASGIEIPLRRRRRGRPRKNPKVTPQNANTNDEKNGDAIITDVSEQDHLDANTTEAQAQTNPDKPPPQGSPVKRGRGRPRRKVTAGSEGQPVVVGRVRRRRVFNGGRGRPRSNKVTLEASKDTVAASEPSEIAAS